MKRANRDAQPSSSSKRHASSASQNNLSLTASNYEHDIANRSGKILRIHLKNFMCHANLVMEFNNRVNLLVGSNGSGKSSILTALVVGLGTKARDTNRSMNVKQLIKTGEISATIEIDIANGGNNSFEHSTYGDKITIIRQITDKGSSQYKIKNEWNQIISKRTDDLQKILLYHNIQPDNPVFVLNQDSARSFLKELNPVKNYQLFLKATQIETIMNKLNECFVLYTDCKHRLGLHKMEVEPLKKQVTELTEKYELLHSAEDIKENIKKFKLEKLWNQVTEQEKIVENLQNEISQEINKKAKLLSKMQNKDEAEKEILNKIRQVEKDIKEKNENLTTENEKLQILKNELIRENDRYSIEERMCNKLEGNINYLKEQIQQLQSGIEERSQSSSAHINKIREKNESAMAEINANMKQIQAMIASLKQELKLQSGRKDQILQQFDNIKRKRDQMFHQISALRKDLERLTISEKDSMLLYGNHMSAILNEIEKAAKSNLFTAMPRGPIGRYVQVPNEKWLAVVEQLLGGNLLTAFLVNNAADRMVLDKIIKQKFPGVKITIITSKFHNQVYNVHDGMVIAPKGTTLLMDQITCLDPIVMNCLIDQGSIETILLTEDQNLAEQLTKDIENVPTNLLKVIVLKPFLEYRPAPLFRIYSDQLRPSKYLKVDITLRKKQIEIEIKQCNQTVSNFEAEMNKVNVEQKEIQITLQKIKSKLQRNEEEYENKSSQLNELKNFEYPNENEIEILEKELLTIQDKLRSTEKQLEEKQKIRLKCLQNKMDKEKIVNKQKELIQSLEESLPQLKTEYDNLKLQHYTQQNDLRRQGDILKELDVLIKASENEFNEKITELEKYKKKAQEMGDRVNSTKSIEELDSLINKLERKIKHISRTQGNIEDIQILLEQKRTQLEKNEALIDAATENLCLLKKTRDERMKMIENIKSMMALRLKWSFQTYLKLREFSGGIKIDHVNKTLTIQVIPRGNHVTNAISQTESLSGGERSYTTISFLLSLWCCIDHPFYFLDEYDVFTDQINRQIMAKLLLKEARDKPHRQYVFLTPQDMSFVKASEEITIHRLQDPRE